MTIIKCVALSVSIPYKSNVTEEKEKSNMNLTHSFYCHHRLRKPANIFLLKGLIVSGFFFSVTNIYVDFQRV